ncbi:MAG: redox-regulated ATPase YchF [Candidatus Bathyarchaeia archaeon]|nr:redox-regulated ATPase YchF [Candidatus Bathyarchaeota archaeon]
MPTVKIGIIGKTNTGKTTFFNAATLLRAEVGTYPFTTKKPNIGIGYARSFCVCSEFNIKDNPRNSICIRGFRFIPVELIDLPGLIKGAWMGKGLGNQFLTVASQADVLLHVVDASGSINQAGELVAPGIGDPVQDVLDIEEELNMWLYKILEGSRARIIKMLESRTARLIPALTQLLSGLKITRAHIEEALKLSELNDKPFEKWSQDELKLFAANLRKVSKPTVIVANKIDIKGAEENYERLIEVFKPTPVIPCSAEAELALRRAESDGLVEYLPGDEIFKVLSYDQLSERQKAALKYVTERVFEKISMTGVQYAIDVAVFKLLRMNVVYPVEDENKLTDSKGNILPDAFLMPQGATVYDLAMEIHSDLANTMLYAIDARTKIRLPKDYILRDRDVIKIVAAAGRG